MQSRTMGQNRLTKSYNELINLESYDERLAYLSTKGLNPSNAERYLMNKFYKSDRWLYIKDKVIQRDLACDMGIENLFINEGPILVHHINPIFLEDIENDDPKILDMNNLITVSLNTHNAIHFYKKEISIWKEREPGDTKLW